ncbi:DUF3857 domain-containing transglutaminase family protein [Brevundimonas sp. R86498]|uniref:DUF3857 domain-containing transglutaminase family protein n=1 Tax=Brevundimonas sp. R86498 TaxID=3093845 RepID=UPI0037C6ECAC
MPCSPTEQSPRSQGATAFRPQPRFDTTFNPRYERIVIHTIRVHRGGEVREAGKLSAFQVIQRELNLERAVYDGRITAHMVIPDLREGDIVETAYSVIGANPALEGRFACSFILQWSDPVVETRCTVRLASSRPVRIRKWGAASDPVETGADGIRCLDWRVIGQAPYRTEQGSPPSFVGYAAVQVADRMTWAEVADVFRAHYQPTSQLPGDLADTVAAIASSRMKPGEKLVEGLRLVQDALRYHSVSVAEGGYRPRPIDEIWRTRYGDCKDGSVLLVGVLRALGINADCALVNTAHGDDLAEAPPNVLAFDHCIVRARVAGRTVWLDATLPRQAGDLDHLTRADFHWALPMTGSATLERMEPAPMATVCETEEVWTFSRRRTMPAQLILSSTYRAWRADGMRRWIANEGPQNISRLLREGLEGDLRSPLRETAAVQIVDDVPNNSLTLVERYDVERPFAASEFGRGEVFYSRDEVVGPHLPVLGPDRRREPLQLGLPRRVVARKVLNFPVRMQISPWKSGIKGPGGARLDTRFAWQSRKVGVHTMTLESGERVLPAKLGEAYRDFTNRAFAMNGIRFPVDYRNGRMVPARKPGRDRGLWSWIKGLLWLLWLGYMLLLVVGPSLPAG